MAPAFQIYFEQGNFQDQELLINIYENLNRSLSSPSLYMESSNLFLGLSLRSFLLHYKRKVLALLKLLLLEHKIIFYSTSPVSDACSQALTLASLIPNTLEQGLNFTQTKPNDNNLPVFNENYLLQPYLVVQQLDLLKEANPILAGTSNALFIHSLSSLKDTSYAIINVYTKKITFSLMKFKFVY